MAAKGECEARTSCWQLKPRPADPFGVGGSERAIARCFPSLLGPWTGAGCPAFPGGASLWELMVLAPVPPPGRPGDSLWEPYARFSTLFSCVTPGGGREPPTGALRSRCGPCVPRRGTGEPARGRAFVVCGSITCDKTRYDRKSGLNRAERRESLVHPPRSCILGLPGTPRGLPHRDFGPATSLIVDFDRITPLPPP